MANKFQLAEAFTEFTIKGFTAFKSQMQQVLNDYEEQDDLAQPR